MAVGQSIGLGFECTPHCRLFGRKVNAAETENLRIYHPRRRIDLQINLKFINSKIKK
jgi:hypothetical protein